MKFSISIFPVLLVLFFISCKKESVPPVQSVYNVQATLDTIPGKTVKYTSVQTTAYFHRTMKQIIIESSDLAQYNSNQLILIIDTPDLIALSDFQATRYPLQSTSNHKIGYNKFNSGFCPQLNTNSGINITSIEEAAGGNRIFNGTFNATLRKSISDSTTMVIREGTFKVLVQNY